MLAADASRHKCDSKVRRSISSMLSNVKPRGFHSQSRASIESSASRGAFLPDRGNAMRHCLAQPAHRKHNVFCSIIRRVVDEISTGVFIHGYDSKAVAHQREKRRRLVSRAATYGCITIRISGEYYDMPTLARDSGLRTFGIKRELDDDLQPPSYAMSEVENGLEESLSRHIDNSEGAPSWDEPFNLLKHHQNVSGEMLRGPKLQALILVDETAAPESGGHYVIRVPNNQVTSEDIVVTSSACGSLAEQF